VPATTPTVGVAVVDCLSRQVSVLVAAGPAVRRGDLHSLHQMTVAVRRLRGCLAAFAELFIPRATDHVRDELEWLGRVLSQVPSHEPAEQESAAQALAGERYRALVCALERFVARPPLRGRADRPAADAFAPLVANACQRVEKAVDELRAGHPEHLDHALRRVRSAARRARYAADAARPAVGEKAQSLADAMNELETTVDASPGRQDLLRVWASTRRVVARWPG
jgi:CHAD domain-containing protein